jgi:hypothetical protein
MKQLLSRLEVVQRMWHKQRHAAKAQSKAKKQTRTTTIHGRRIIDQASHD